MLNYFVLQNGLRDYSADDFHIVEIGEHLADILQTIPRESSAEYSSLYEKTAMALESII